MCVKAVWSEYTRECKAILTAVEIARLMKEQAEECYANAQTQQQADTADANIRHALHALTQVCFLALVASPSTHSLNSCLGFEPRSLCGMLKRTKSVTP